MPVSVVSTASVVPVGFQCSARFGGHAVRQIASRDGARRFRDGNRIVKSQGDGVVRS